MLGNSDQTLEMIFEMNPAWMLLSLFRTHCLMPTVTPNHVEDWACYITSV
jgi:hypothetical protein